MVGVKINFIKKLLKNNHTEEDISDEESENNNAKINHIAVYDEMETNDFGNVCEIPVKYGKTPVYIDFKEEINKTCQHLSEEQRSELVTVLENHRNVFQDRPGLSSIGSHKIRLMEDKKLFKKKLYPIPIILRDEVDKQIEELLSEGIIEKSISPFQHPVVMIRKPDSTYRMTNDY